MVAMRVMQSPSVIVRVLGSRTTSVTLIALDTFMQETASVTKMNKVNLILFIVY